MPSVRKIKELAREQANNEPCIEIGTDVPDDNPTSARERPFSAPFAPYKQNLAKKGLFTHATLVDGGECKPGFKEENILKYGYESVKAHVIRGPGDQSRKEIAEHWGVKPATLGQWAVRGKWNDLRREYQAQRQQQVELARVADGRTAEIRRAEFEEMELADIKEARGIIMGNLRKTTEDYVTPLGLESGNRSSQSLKHDVTSLTALYTHGRLNLGMATKGSTPVPGTVNMQQINFISETRPTPAETTAYVLETLSEVLPPDALSPEELEEAILEGEVS